MSALVMIWDAKGEPFEVSEKKVAKLLSAGFALLPPSASRAAPTVSKKRRSAKVTTDE